MWLAVSSFMVLGFVSRLSLAHHLPWPVFGLTQGPFWWCAHLSAKMDSSVRVSGRLAGRIISLLLLAPPGFFWVSFTRHTTGCRVLPPFRPSQILSVFGGSTVFPVRTSYHETAHASGYRHAWPTWVGSVHSSLRRRQGPFLSKLLTPSCPEEVWLIYMQVHTAHWERPTTKQGMWRPVVCVLFAFL